jgi:hypothetical protein
VGKKRDAALSIFQTEVIEHVHVNKVNAACRNFFLDRTDLVTKFYDAQEAGKPRELMLSIPPVDRGETSLTSIRPRKAHLANTASTWPMTPMLRTGGVEAQ